MSNEMLEPEKWVGNYADMLYRYTLVLVKDPDVADEFVQLILFAAFKSQHTFVGKLTKKTWLFEILKNKAMDNFTSLKKISPSISPMLIQTASSLKQRGICPPPLTTGTSIREKPQKIKNSPRF
jgi:DNA-directed RNA polymerase specialized sigma24 family protein|tara:strand:- start:315 stop:686 length:372 start_codon:yes stop_codon:yes gene_type:complete